MAARSGKMYETLAQKEWCAVEQPAKSRPTPRNTRSGTDVTPAERAALERWDETELGMFIARRCLVDAQSKVHVAKVLGLSRFQVARLLSEAVDRGYVRIEIGRPGRIDEEASHQLRQLLGVAEVVVVQTGPGANDERSVLRLVADVAADALDSRVAEGDVLGLAWSRLIETMSHRMRRLHPCTVIQLGGALHLTGNRLGSVEVIRQIAAIANGTARPIYAPQVAIDAATARGLRRQPEIAETLELADDLDLALVSVGTWRPSGSAVFDAVPEKLRNQATTRGACGEILGRLFDCDGNPVNSPLDDRLIGITADQLRAVPKIIATATGAYRAEATIAAIRAGLVHILVIDDDLARTILNSAGTVGLSTSVR